MQILNKEQPTYTSEYSNGAHSAGKTVCGNYPRIKNESITPSYMNFKTGVSKQLIFHDVAFL